MDEWNCRGDCGSRVRESVVLCAVRVQEVVILCLICLWFLTLLFERGLFGSVYIGAFTR